MVLVSVVRHPPAPAPDGMDVQAMTVWLTAFGDAWERRNADATAALFAPAATFQPSPFGELVRGRSRIAAHWAEVMSGQQAIRFQGEILGVGAIYGIAHQRVVIGRHDDRPIRVVDGILFAAFDRRGLTCDDARMGMQIDGRLEGGAATVGTYDYVVGDKKVSVALHPVSVTWARCADGSDATEQALQKWFDEELATQVLVTAVPSSVHWRMATQAVLSPGWVEPGSPGWHPIATR